ncbi:HAD-IA family hydrolase [Actinotalea sp. M2MS4P-6]|uniref:HAD-IA family hydrolase n=1 Tax=Actinotalea sp. M2MS4P-6 TaxID=2983762 RepID=UPI0021E3DE36|nr:HAD-IA family hydrolase [Actinotalea sp. M2MS4P-6]MCV2393139.1 HAD-IA family hydrolase [Actinotalea sp. M2MS4P-6]
MRIVLLDLDGTLTDPQVGILASYDHAMASLGLPPVPAERRHACIGPPLRDVFADLGVPAERLDDAVAGYREYFAPTGMFENRVYDGIPEALAAMRDAGLRLAVATSKPEPYARRILEHFELDGWFEHIAGATLDGRVGAKADIIALALEALGAEADADVVMVGDRSHDVLGAAAHGLACLGVAWGYAAPGELEAAGAIAVARDPAELVELVLG